MLKAAIVILVPLIIYLAGYFALLKDDLYILMPYPNTPRPWIYDRPAEYRIGGRVASVIFWPANRLDRLIRPSAWRIDLERLRPKETGD